MSKQFTVAVCGCGSRGYGAYSVYQKNHPDRMKIVAAADLRPERLELMKKEFGLSDEACYSTGMEMLSQPKLADFVIIAIQDQDHVAHTIKALEMGYDVLCEKPISPDLGECLALQEAVQKSGRKVFICHVLRYAPFFTTLKGLLEDGAIGDVMNLDLIEHVQYWHQAHSFVRGNWRNSEETSPMILQKSCHDMDIIRWLMGTSCEVISSFGDLSYFNADHAPEGAADRCLECPYVDSCVYSAKKFYIEDERKGVATGHTGWPVNVVANPPTVESVLEALKEGPYGRCVFKCDNNVVDHQVVSMRFEKGAIATFTMSAFCDHGSRWLRIMGTKGDILADMSNNSITLTPFGGKSEIIPLKAEKDEFAGHGGGDHRLLENFMDVLEGVSTETRTSVDASVESHVMALAAEYSRKHDGEAIKLADFAAAARK
ncbi:MAG: Gfo/Idh/MocA family oxidoreductase [Oscillospiraceae bacterium]|nr:Gfo/Idh/MocA family oxidoreductase [Oscillospiraceae bacterium]